VLPSDFDPVKSVLLVTFREVLSAIRRFGFQAGEAVLVLGLGPVGLSFVRMCKSLGMHPVVAVDVAPEKVAAAKAFGADFAFDGTVDVQAEIKKLFPSGIDNIVDAAGVNALINQALEVVKYNGKIGVYGIAAETEMRLDWAKAPYNWQLLFVQWPSKKEEADAHDQVIAWLKEGVLAFDDFISDIVPFSDILDAFHDALSGKTRKKVIIKF
jgi:threonine dehydrogenase-like Zn-dependent dehydrogenase